MPAALCRPHKQECNSPFSPADFDLADFFDTPVETTTRPAKPTPKPFPRPGKPGKAELLPAGSSIHPRGTPSQGCPCVSWDCANTRALSWPRQPQSPSRVGVSPHPEPTFQRVTAFWFFLFLLSDNGFWDVIRTTTTKQPKTTRAPPKRNPGEHHLHSPCCFTPALLLAQRRIWDVPGWWHCPRPGISNL